jgi:hypothetical protein
MTSYQKESIRRHWAKGRKFGRKERPTNTVPKSYINRLKVSQAEGVLTLFHERKELVIPAMHTSYLATQSRLQRRSIRARLVRDITSAHETYSLIALFFYPSLKFAVRHLRGR